MNTVNKTLYIPLYGKSYVSKKGLFLKDPKAEEIWASEDFELKGKSKSKWLAYYMGIRSAVFDQWTKAQMNCLQDAVVLHIGCGMDARALRIGVTGHQWYDIDFPQVMEERKRYYEETDSYHMLASDVRSNDWPQVLPQSEEAIVVMEGVSMYLTAEDLQSLMESLAQRFSKVVLLMDCYTSLAAKLSKYKNPINDVGVTQVYGIDDPALFESCGISFYQEHSMTPCSYIDELSGIEKRIFSKLYAGEFSQKLYRLYEYRKG